MCTDLLCPFAVSLVHRSVAGLNSSQNATCLVRWSAREIQRVGFSMLPRTVVPDLWNVLESTRTCACLGPNQKHKRSGTSESRSPSIPKASCIYPRPAAVLRHDRGADLRTHEPPPVRASSLRRAVHRSRAGCDACGVCRFGRGGTATAGSAGCSGAGAGH